MRALRSHLMTTTRGATGMEYGVLIALVGLLAVGAVAGTGYAVRDSFGLADNALASSAAVASAQPTGPGTGVPTDETPEDDAACYVDEEGNSTLNFDAESGITCVELQEGDDTLSMTTDEDVVISGTGGRKAITLGNGSNTVQLNSAWISGSGGGIGPAPIVMGNGDNSFTMTGGGAQGVRTGSGNDTIRYIGVSGTDNMMSHGEMLYVSAGTGTNDVEASCDASRLMILNMRGGETTHVDSEGCTIYAIASGMPSIGGTADPDENPTQARSYTARLNGGFAHAFLSTYTTPVGPLDITATNTSGLQFGVITGTNVQTGPIRLDLSTGNASQPLLAQLNLVSAGGIPSHEAVSVSIHEDESLGEPTGHSGVFNMVNPGTHWVIDADIRSAATTITFSDVPEGAPGDIERLGFPRLTTPEPRPLVISIPMYDHTVVPVPLIGWTAILTGPNGPSEPLVCSSSHDVLADVYTGITLTSETMGRSFSTSFNGGEGPNGDTLKVSTLYFSC